MPRAAFVVLLGIVVSATARAEPLPRAYFEATPPGGWAKYETATGGGGKSAATYTRLADHDGGMVLEIASEFLEGPGAGGRSTSIFLLAADFDWRQDFLSFGKSLTGATFLMEGRPPMVQPETMVEAMRAAMSDFGDGFAGKGAGTGGVAACDLFSYRATSGGPNAGTMEGDVCLSAEVPFGVVTQIAASRNEKSGETSFETRLLESGTGGVREAPAAALGAAAAPPGGAAGEAMPAPVNLALAYQRGQIALHFRVFPGSGGRALQVSLENPGPHTVAIATGTSTYAFEVGPPIGTLMFSPVYDEVYPVAPGQRTAPFHAGQPIGRGVQEGAFRLQMHEGVPTFSGEVTVGDVGS